MVRHLMDLKPSSILDIGVGFGKVGYLAREYLEVWSRRYDKSEWKTKVYGIEAFERYRNPAWDFYYDKVLIGDANQLIDDVPQVDLITCLDVIEHFEKREGTIFLEKCLAKARHVIISSPIKFYAQDAVFGNVHEVHRSHWREEDFRDYDYVFQTLPPVFVCRLWKRPAGANPTRVRQNRLAFASGRELARAFVNRVLKRVKR